MAVGAMPIHIVRPFGMLDIAARPHQMSDPQMRGHGDGGEMRGETIAKDHTI
ncbi:hypothetical protein AIOL_002369 [Candidatus Rhodobacter oscarellae]|uniref:Uncharacterized protein n=1 Tax=Candidatus Rhodobacter oscarellae TaxID=1675527 RepID=A0A0J9E3M3_9RHOB|nr:hypothetical protein AIOL_002369 [Candidatus Rhodobacter lobularis]